jgi:hypothetical protein
MHNVAFFIAIIVSILGVIRLSTFFAECFYTECNGKDKMTFASYETQFYRLNCDTELNT